MNLYKITEQKLNYLGYSKNTDKMKNTKQLKEEYESVCNEYLDRFCEKQGLENEGWVGGIIAGTADCSGYYFNFQDIVWDINSNQPEKLIIEWYDESMDDILNSVNYYSYTKIKDKS